ncbi:MAG: hypothetical protein WCW13_03025 [archaeon]|jgi:uncharacterized protein (UPF0333 family)
MGKFCVKIKEFYFFSKKGQISMEFMVTTLLILGVFVFGLSIFQQRSDLNISSSAKWFSHETASRIARNINNVYLLDDNSLLTDSIYWADKGMSISLSGRNVTVVTSDFSADAALVTNRVVWNVSDFNGLIYFRKINGSVVVGYS